MSDEFETSDSNSEESDSLAKLLKLAGPRAEIPRGIEMRIYDRVRRDWKASIQQPDSSKIYKKVRRAWKRDGRLDVLMRWTLPLGGVAAAVIAILVLIQPPPPPIVAVATVSKVIAAATANSRYTEAMTVHTGDSIITGDGEGLSLLLTRSESLRVDENTELRVDARDRFTLLSGRVYVDTGQFVYRDGDLTIETAFGSVTDVGTQFAVSARDQHLDVAVREGRVDIANDNTEFAVMMGERFTLGHDDGGSISSLRANDEYWNWVADLAPGFDTENASLLEFLEWAARETGRELIFDSDAQRMAAMRIDVNGRISNLTPDEALRAVLPTTSVRYQIEAGKIIIER